METVAFDCPHCGRVCAFKDRYIGRRARCTHCNTRFYVPAAGQPARPIAPVYADDQTFSGFWTALLKDTPAVLLHPHSLAGLGIMIILSLLRYQIGHPLNILRIGLLMFPYGILTLLPTTLFQCWYLIETIQATIDQQQGDALPLFVGPGWLDRFYEAIGNTYMLLMLTALSLLPAMVLAGLLPPDTAMARWAVPIAAAGGVYVLPLALTIFAYSRDMLLCFRLDCILRASRKAFWPHLLLAAMSLATLIVLTNADFYARTAAPDKTVVNIALHSAAVVLSLLTARAAGLFYRHYGCYLP